MAAAVTLADVAAAHLSASISRASSDKCGYCVCTCNSHSCATVGTVPEDVDLDGYERHLESEAAPAPLSMEEMEKKELQSLEVGVNVGSSTRKACVATGTHLRTHTCQAIATAHLRTHTCEAIATAPQTRSAPP